jgi:hypothetical protein
MQTIKYGVLTGLLVLMTSSLLPMAAHAASEENQLVLNYDGFFDRLEDLNESEYQDIKLAFYFMNQQGDACPVKSVRLQTQLNKMEVYYLPSGEILLPFDHQLDADKAAIVIEKADDQICGLNMRLESVILLDKDVDVTKAKSLISTFDLALNDLAGMMSFTLPDVVGISFKAAADETLTINNMIAGECKLNSCTLSLADLDLYQDKVSFSHSIVKALPFIK